MIDDSRLAHLIHTYELPSSIDQLRTVVGEIADALARDFLIGDLTVAQRAEIEGRILERVCATASRSPGTNIAKSSALNTREFFRREAMLAVQEVLQADAFERSLGLLSAVRAQFQSVITQIDRTFTALEESGTKLELTNLARNKPPHAPRVENATTQIFRLGTLIEKRALPFSVAKLRDIESGIRAVLGERYPNSLESDFQPIVDVVRDRAISALSENDSKWPHRKGNWYVSQIDELTLTNPELFTAVLIRN